jgi:deoxycytidylate deaminase
VHNHIHPFSERFGNSNMRLSVVKQAVREALKSSHKHRHGAVAFKGSLILGVGHNEIRKHPLSTQSAFPEAYHAEISACVKAAYKAEEVFVIRINKKGEWRNSKPCANCMKLMLKLGIKRIWYTNQIGEIRKESLR